MSYLNAAAKAEGTIPSPAANWNMMLREKWSGSYCQDERLRYVASRDDLHPGTKESWLLHDLGTFDGVHLYDTVSPSEPLVWVPRAGGVVTDEVPGTLAELGPNTVHLEFREAVSGDLIGSFPDYPGLLVHYDQGQNRPLPVSAEGQRTIPVTNARVIDMV